MDQLVLDFLGTMYEQYQFDINIMSQQWMYWTVVPIILYLPFFFLKWTVLTFPLWITPVMVLRFFKELVVSYFKYKK